MTCDCQVMCLYGEKKWRTGCCHPVTPHLFTKHPQQVPLLCQPPHVAHVHDILCAICCFLTLNVMHQQGVALLIVLYFVQ